jgi:hypothetical protein
MMHEQVQTSMTFFVQLSSFVAMFRFHQRIFFR